MVIENLGSKLYSGTKADRKSDSLGSDADGTNTGITLIQSATGGTDLTSSSQSYTQVGTTVVKTNDTITATATSASSAGDGTQRVYTALPEKLNDVVHTTDFDLKITANASSGDPDVTPLMYTAGAKPFHTGNSQDGFGCDMYSDSGNGNNKITRLGQFMFEDGTHVPAGLPYHIHPDNGAMEGAEHNPDIPGGQLGHTFLIPSNKPVDKMSYHIIFF